MLSEWARSDRSGAANDGGSGLMSLIRVFYAGARRLRGERQMVTRFTACSASSCSWPAGPVDGPVNARAATISRLQSINKIIDRLIENTSHFCPEIRNLTLF